MKHTVITLALAALLLLALLAGPAAAVRSVPSGSDAFVYETITIPGSNGAPLIKYSGDSTPVAVNTISGTPDGTYNLLEQAVGTNTGTYYLNAYGDPFSVNIWYPEMSLKAYLGATSYDSIDGKTITKDTLIRFIIEAPKVGPATGFGGPNAPVKIVFTTPVGGKTTDFGNGAFDAASLGEFQGSVQLVTPVTAAGYDATTGTYVAQAEFTNSDFIGIPDKYKKSNTISFTVQSSEVTLTANKDTVIRSNPFTVTIQGVAQTLYFVYLEENGASSSPLLQPGQSGMRSGPDFITIPEGIYDCAYNPATYAYFTTDASGKRTIQYNTFADTEAMPYTVKAVGVFTPVGSTCMADEYYDSVEVIVEHGEVTITADGDRNYYIGDKIKLTGTNTDSSNVWLFITGPGLDEDGQLLNRLPNKESAGVSRYADATVKTDSTWEYNWDTARCGLDTGIYTIYATSVLTNGKSFEPNVTAVPYIPPIQSAEYATLALSLKEPYLTAEAAGTAVSQGTKITVTGEATGSPSMLKLYIFGQNYYESSPLFLNKNGTYEGTVYIPSNQQSDYTILLEHPMYNGIIDVIENRTQDQTILATLNPSGGIDMSFVVWGSSKLSGANAAYALSKMIDSANIDDIYQTLDVTIEEPWVLINSPGTHVPGTAVTITGTTNLGAGEQLFIDIVPVTAGTGIPGTSQFVTIRKGDDITNLWSLTVSTSKWNNGEYRINATGIENDCLATASLTLSSHTAAPDTLTLASGWNFISVPKTLAPDNNTAASLFGNVDTAARNPLAYDANTSQWITIDNPATIIKPMTGIWIYAVSPAQIPLTYPDKPAAPAVHPIYPGWNAIGLSADYATTAENALAGTAWRTLLPWNLASGSWDAAIINGGSGANSGERMMTTGNGYWLYVSEAGTLTGLTA